MKREHWSTRLTDDKDVINTMQTKTSDGRGATFSIESEVSKIHPPRQQNDFERGRC